MFTGAMTMRRSRVLDKWAQDEPCLGVAVHSTDASVYELVSLMGFDLIWMDLEHHAHSVQTAESLMRAARLGVSDIMARPAKGEFMRLGRLLEAGANGIMYPRCDDEAEAEHVVRWSKFAPLGERGLGGGGPDMPYGSMPVDRYVQEANANTFIAIQLESPAAVDRAEAIATVTGVNLLFFGPGDYSVLTGVPGQVRHAKVDRAVARVAEAAAATGQRWGTVSFSPEHSQMLLEMGASMIVPANDMDMLAQGLRQLQSTYAGLSFRFESRLCEPVVDRSARDRPSTAVTSYA
ncbi:HpcH/HpaI aldolase/citrate lyase family protein [Phycisphaerales bacterium AB-hyl4]|uniref:HpcH/HpaI aldolase/citrate lyase family protein n=1 Tax=Natronomicrosphaera hydrolytica TaxID=3242702 RepID=A0ABV4UAZ5_9BACT